MELINEIVTSLDVAAYPQVEIRIPKKVATIKLCGGGLTFHINDTMEFTMPTEEQRKNLKEMLCIEVIPIENN